MEKNRVSIIVICLVAFNCSAQLVKFGVKAGVNYANQTGSDITLMAQNYKSTDAITSFHAGLVAEIKVIEQLAIQPEILYSTQGATYKNALEKFNNELGYLSIPVLAKIKMNKFLSLNLGPQASFLLSEKNKFDYKKSETFEFAAAGGLSVNLSEKLFLDGRYVLGLTEASKEAKTKNSLVQVSLGYFFR